MCLGGYVRERSRWYQSFLTSQRSDCRSDETKVHLHLSLLVRIFRKTDNEVRRKCCRLAHRFPHLLPCET